mmetsp:Transcript_76094/g.211561  ORF Transcript_76094/g.211561 Transcript_76094/m.211561 type:complete len:242 (-) Transcript_76094:482-1207(-)
MATLASWASTSPCDCPPILCRADTVAVATMVLWASTSKARVFGSGPCAVAACSTASSWLVAVSCQRNSSADASASEGSNGACAKACPALSGPASDNFSHASETSHEPLDGLAAERQVGAPSGATTGVVLTLAKCASVWVDRASPITSVSVCAHRLTSAPRAGAGAPSAAACSSVWIEASCGLWCGSSVASDPGPANLPMQSLQSMCTGTWRTVSPAYSVSSSRRMRLSSSCSTISSHGGTL